jgi:hypothetical protein
MPEFTKAFCSTGEPGICAVAATPNQAGAVSTRITGKVFRRQRMLQIQAEVTPRKAQ